MRILIRFVIVTLLISCELSQIGAVDQNDVDYYVELINNRSRDALGYEFPTDAKMYEPEDKVLRGMIPFFNYGYSIFIRLGVNSLWCITKIFQYRMSVVKRFVVYPRTQEPVLLIYFCYSFYKYSVN